MALATIRLYLNESNLNVKGQAPLLIRITKDRKNKYKSTGIRLLSKQWNKDTQKVRVNHPFYKQLNGQLDKLMNDYQASVTKEETIAPTISVNRIKENISGKYHSNDFFAIADEMNARYRAEGKVGTEALGKSVLNKFKSFVNSDTLQFDEITPNLLNKYQNFLITELGNKTNTVGKDLKYIGRVINKAISLDIINESINPFRKF